MKKAKYFLSLFIAFAMVLPMFATTALAAGTPTSQNEGYVTLRVYNLVDDCTTAGYEDQAAWRGAYNSTIFDSVDTTVLADGESADTTTSTSYITYRLLADDEGNVTVPGPSVTEISDLSGLGKWVLSGLVIGSTSASGATETNTVTVNSDGTFTVPQSIYVASTDYRYNGYLYTWVASDDTVDVTYDCENATEGPTSYSRMESQWAEDYKNGNTNSGYISHYVPSVTAASAGSEFTVANWGDDTEESYVVTLFDGRRAFFVTHSNGSGSGVVWIYQGYKYSTDGGTTWSDLVSVYEETGDTVTYNGYTWPEYELVSTTIDVPEDATGVCIAYQFTAAATTNFIYELRDDRLVYQNNVLLGASVYEDTDAGTWDTYNVSSTEGITVEYTPTMNMENLGSDVFTFFSWDVLQAYETSITDDTRIYLHFFFDTGYIDLANSDFSEAYLVSDMFDLVDESTGETAISVNAETGEVLVTCQWDSTSADAIYAANGELDPMIYFKGFTLAVTDNWGTDADGNDVTSIKIFNDGYVDGVVDMDETGKFLAGKFAIWGGYEDDTFILQLAGKVTEPSLDKTIVTDTGSADQDDVAAGEDVEFKLTSTIPDTLKDHISYSVGEDGTVSGTVNSTTDEETGKTVYDTYKLVFHDAMDSALTLNEKSIVVAINGTALSSDYYTITVGASDGCTFEVSMDLLALYTAGIIDETYFGTATVTVTYTATLSSTATAGSYTNTAWVTFDEESSKPDEVEVDTYGIQVFKYDQSTAKYDEDGTTVTSATGLGGAVFTLTYPDGTREDYTTDSNGYISLDGLDAGTYSLVETTAPDGYVASGDTLTVTVNADNTTANVAYVYVANAAIPSTGGAGTTMYTAVGVCIILIAGAALVVTRKTRREE